MPTTVLPAPQNFQTLRRPCRVDGGQNIKKNLNIYLLIKGAGDNIDRNLENWTRMTPFFLENRISTYVEVEVRSLDASWVNALHVLG